MQIVCTWIKIQVSCKHSSNLNHNLTVFGVCDALWRCMTVLQEDYVDPKLGFVDASGFSTLGNVCFIVPPENSFVWVRECSFFGICISPGKCTLDRVSSYLLWSTGLCSIISSGRSVAYCAMEQLNWFCLSIQKCGIRRASEDCQCLGINAFIVSTEQNATLRLGIRYHRAREINR